MAEFTRDGDLPGEPTSPWLSDACEPSTADELDARGDAVDFAPLETDRAVDVAVVGGGIAGLSTALEVRERGRTVAVLERDRVGRGTTGRSTAKLTSQHGLIYDHLRREFGRRQARQYARVQEAAIDAVERRIDDWGLDCAFERVPSYLYGDERDALEREADAAQAAGLEATYVTSVPPFERAQAGVRFDEQAQFHPREYLLGIAAALEADPDAGVYEGTRVRDIEPGSPCRVRTDAATVTAERVVVATGFPILDRTGYFARLYPKRSYVLGFRLEGRPPEGLYYRVGENYRSVRTHRGPDGEDGDGDDGDGNGDGGRSLLLVGGENHKTGQGGSTLERYRRLERWARERFPVAEVASRWSAQDYVPVDRVPVIGPIGAAENVLVATGFRGWGLTTGVAAGRLLAGIVAGEEPPARDLFDPRRFTPKTSLGDALTENADAASQFATDWARTLLSPGRESIDPGEGRVVRRGGRPVACARDDDGDPYAVSAVCPHMGCLVQWNDAERSWDCPCHGSRFALDGTVLEGPATEDLSTRGTASFESDSGSDPSRRTRGPDSG